MGILNTIVTIPKTFTVIFTGVFALFLFRVSYPLIDTILGLLQVKSGMAYYVSVFLTYLMFFFCTFVMTYATLFNAKEVKADG